MPKDTLAAAIIVLTVMALASYCVYVKSEQDNIIKDCNDYYQNILQSLNINTPDTRIKTFTMLNVTPIITDTPTLNKKDRNSP